MDLNQAVYAAYVSLLLGLTFAASGAWGRVLAMEPIRRTAIVMAGNWAVNTAYCLALGITDPWWWFLIVDAASARAVMHQPAGKAQAAIGWAYMAQIIMHIVYAVSNHAFAADPYWRVLIALAFVQLIVLGGWHIGHRRNLARDRRGGRAALAPRSRGKGVAP